MTVEEQAPSSPLQRALDAARELGRRDGGLAVDIEPIGEPAEVGSWCHGLGPEDLARLVWAAGAGTVPAGVRLNAPLWYAHGFREALASARAERCRGRPDTPEPRSVSTQVNRRGTMTTTRNPATTPARPDGDRRRARPPVPAPRRPADDEGATPADEWVTYPGVRYALERMEALRRPAADDDPDRA